MKERAKSAPQVLKFEIERGLFLIAALARKRSRATLIERWHGFFVCRAEEVIGKRNRLTLGEEIAPYWVFLIIKEGLVLADTESKGVRKIAVGSEWWDIVDNGTPVEFVDYITEARQMNGVVYISTGNGVIDANNTGVIVINNRLRMSLASAQILHQLLGNMINDALEPIDKSKAN